MAAKNPSRWLPWFAWLLFRPDQALDLNNADGKADHAKRMGFLAFLLNLALIWRGIETGKMPPWSVLLIVNVSLYGWIGLRTLLASGVFHATEEATVALAHTMIESKSTVITERRDAETGTEPTAQP